MQKELKGSLFVVFSHGDDRDIFTYFPTQIKKRTIKVDILKVPLILRLLC